MSDAATIPAPDEDALVREYSDRLPESTIRAAVRAAGKGTSARDDLDALAAAVARRPAR